MPKNLLQEIVFTLIMVVVMVYAMIVYNVAWDAGVSNEMFLLALRELPVMGPIAFVLEFLLVGRLAQRLARGMFGGAQVPPALYTVAVSSIIVALMCPLMSFIASLLFGYTGAGDIAVNFLRIFARNFPMALCWQLFYAGPLVRLLFRLIFVRGRRKGTRAPAGDAEGGARIQASPALPAQARAEAAPESARAGAPLAQGDAAGRGAR